jgi:hypothetical protein
MKQIKKNFNMFKFALPLLFLFGVIITSCDIDKSINQSPNAIDESKIKTPYGMYSLLVGLQVATADYYSGDRSRINSIWTWQMCAPKGLGRPQPVAWNSYSQTQDGPAADMWNIGYRGVKIANDIITYAPEVKFPSAQNENVQGLMGIAKVYKAIILGEMAANYGSIPIAFNGLTPPKFATQGEAYAEVQKILDEAIVHLATTTTIKQELNFKGDGAAWIKVAQSLKARYYLHMSNADKGNMNKALAAANLGIGAASGTLFGIYTESAGEYSPWGHWTKTEVGEPLRAELTFIRLLKSEDPDSVTHIDKRLGDKVIGYFNAGADGDYWGFAQHKQADAKAQEKATANTVKLKKYGSYGDYFPLISYNETILIGAEAKAETGDLPGAVAAINIIRKAAGLPDFASTDKKAIIDQVFKQKNITLFLEGQLYHDMRRTGTLPEAAVPLRWIYPETELNANPNVPVEDDILVEYLTKRTW